KIYEPISKGMKSPATEQKTKDTFSPTEHKIYEPISKGMKSPATEQKTKDTFSPTEHKIYEPISKGMKSPATEQKTKDTFSPTEHKTFEPMSRPGAPKSIVTGYRMSDEIKGSFNPEPETGTMLSNLINKLTGKNEENTFSPTEHKIYEPISKGMKSPATEQKTKDKDNTDRVLAELNVTADRKKE
ncbi:MAG: hypothetical protein K0B02_00005, partial [DPANN group archaeon]|nr:hypothetical protein [DPANN group archaeon]